MVAVVEKIMPWDFDHTQDNFVRACEISPEDEQLVDEAVKALPNGALKPSEALELVMQYVSSAQEMPGLTPKQLLAIGIALGAAVFSH